MSQIDKPNVEIWSDFFKNNVQGAYLHPIFIWKKMADPHQGTPSGQKKYKYASYQFLLVLHSQSNHS